jgi:hypothetical protein
MQGLENLEKRSAVAPPAGPLASDPAAGVRWKRALKGVVAAAFRLHYYRFVRTRMLHDALSASRGATGPGDAPPECRLEDRR